MAIHDEVLDAALRLCRQRSGWTFALKDVVHALPHLNQSSVRTHVGSRCCVTAPKHHPHKWDYFNRVGRGVYEVRTKHRQHRRAPAVRSQGKSLAESTRPYRTLARRDTIHAAVSRSGDFFVAECLEVAVVAQGRTLDQLVDSLRQAIALHLDGEDSARLGLVSSPRLAISYELTSAIDVTST